MISLAIVIGSGVVMWLRQGQSECFQDCVSEVHGKGSHLPWTKWERDGCWAVSSHLSCWVEKGCPRDVSSTDHKMWAFPEPRKITLWPLKLQGQCITGFLPSPCPNPSKELNGAGFLSSETDTILSKTCRVVSRSVLSLPLPPVNPKGNQPWIFTGRTDAKAETPILWPPDEKSWIIGKDLDAG